MITKWKEEFRENSSFDKNASEPDKDVDVDKLYSKIGQLEMDHDFLKKD